MKETGDGPGRAPRTKPAGNEQLLQRLAQALEGGVVSAEDVEGLLSRGRPRTSVRPAAAGVLSALGAVVVFCGLAIAYGTLFEDLPWAARIATPYLFPLAALGACVWLSRHGRAWWWTDLAGLVGYVALGAAFGVSAGASGWVESGDEVSAFVAVAALAALVVVAAVHRETRSPRLLWVGMPAALAAFGIGAAHLAGLWEEDVEGLVHLGWVVLAEAGIAAVAAVILTRLGRSDDCLYATLWAALGGYAAVMFCGDDLTDFSVWHLILAAVVIAAFITAATLDFTALVWIAAAGGAWWVVMIAVVVGSATGAALAVVLAGMGLVGLSALVARLRREPPMARR